MAKQKDSKDSAIALNLLRKMSVELAGMMALMKEFGPAAGEVARDYDASTTRRYRNSETNADSRMREQTASWILAGMISTQGAHGADVGRAIALADELRLKLRAETVLPPGGPL